MSTFCFLFCRNLISKLAIHPCMTRKGVHTLKTDLKAYVFDWEFKKEVAPTFYAFTNHGKNLNNFTSFYTIRKKVFTLYFEPHRTWKIQDYLTSIIWKLRAHKNTRLPWYENWGFIKIVDASKTLERNVLHQIIQCTAKLWSRVLDKLGDYWYTNWCQNCGIHYKTVLVLVHTL